MAIGKEGQNARLAARLTGWRIEIKSETQIAAEAAYGKVDWAEGEWVLDPDTGEQVWRPAEGGPTVSLDEWTGAAAAPVPTPCCPEMGPGPRPCLMPRCPTMGLGKLRTRLRRELRTHQCPTLWPRTRRRERVVAKKMRVYDLARELGISNTKCLELCKSLGIGVKATSSSMDEAHAYRVRKLAERENLLGSDAPEPEAPPEPARPKSPAPPEKPAPAAAPVATAPPPAPPGRAP